jgi:hypothetical protein
MKPQQTRPGRVSEAGSKISVAAGSDSMVKPLAASSLLRAEVARILARIDVAEPVRRRVVQEALSDALAYTWRRKAELYEWARARPGDFHGNATAAELAERDRLLAAQALACRNKATLLELGLLDEFEVTSDVR